ncbi:PRC-barrel domain-containing protein [Thermodesulfitimonas sp.]
MRKSKELLGMPVVSLEEGLRVGRVTGLVVDPAAKTVAALIVEKGGLFREQRFIPFPQVYSIGANAVTLHRSQQAAKEVRSKSQHFGGTISAKIKNLRRPAQKPSEAENSGELIQNGAGDDQSKSFDTERSS